LLAHWRPVEGAGLLCDLFMEAAESQVAEFQDAGFLDGIEDF
jgi:hypothetical protein